MSDGLGLDDTDRALIAELIADGRATYAKLAPVVGLSQASVRTRVQRLLDEGIVVVTGRVDPATFGLGVFAFAFLEIGAEIDKAVARLAGIDEAVFVAVGAGRFDLLVELRCTDSDHLVRILDRVRVIDGVRRMQSATVLHYEKQDWTGVGNRGATARRGAPVRSADDLDDIDRLLLRELIADGRASYAALAPVAGLSQAAVRDRVIDLIDSNVIAIEAHPLAEAMGIGGFAAIAIRAAGSTRAVVDALVDCAESTLVARTLGLFDITAELWFDDNDHLAEVLDRLRALRGVASIETVPYLRIAKEQFRLGSAPLADETPK